MELNPATVMTKKEARELSSVLAQTVFRFKDSAEPGEFDNPFSERQQAVAALAISQLSADTDSDVVAMKLYPEELKDLVGVAQIGLRNPGIIVSGMITDIESDPSILWDQQGNAFRALATTADFVELAINNREW